MTLEELNEQVYEKMLSEQDAFKDELIHSSPEFVMDRAYELVIREDILLSMEEMALEDVYLSEKQCRALLKSKTPLSDIFRAFENRPTRHMEEIRDTIESCANSIIRKEFMKNRQSGNR